MNRRERIKYLTDNREEALFLAHACDLAEKAEHTGLAVGDFADPARQQMVESILKGADVTIVWQGGYEDAERSRLVLCRDPEEVRDFISILRITAKNGLSHRDCLGAILGLGLKREKIGDLIVQESVCHAVVAAEIADHICASLQEVGRQKVVCQTIESGQDWWAGGARRRVSTTVASLRLDAVVAAGFGVSRAEAAGYVKGEKVKLNHRLKTEPSAEVHPGDVISARGLGRLWVIEVGGRTKKDRVKVVLERSG